MGPIPGPPRQKKKSRNASKSRALFDTQKQGDWQRNNRFEAWEQATLQFRAWYFYRNPRVIIDKFRLPQMT
jgi:hypothetical protein